ncbi:MAG TPA: hypothetical protein VKZ76_00105 [Edaphocola sp.]|nr:hypothetical protein [Edaphocola sp.]
MLIGEYSGFHQNLRDGLLELGHEAIVAGRKDGKKQISVDIDLDAVRSGILGKLERVWKSYRFSKAVNGYDVIQLINPWIFPKGLGLNEFLIRRILRHNLNVFLSACGDDAMFVMKGAQQLRYHPFKEAIQYDLKVIKHPLDSAKSLAWNEELASAVKGIVPIGYEYAVGYVSCPNLKDCIPLPINTKKIKYIDNRVNRKITIFHGLNRYGFKGTRHIEAAFEVLKRKYPNDVDFIIAGGVPLAEYLKLLERANVVVDQTNSYSCGMNAIYAMAMGKVVMGGAEPETLQAYGVDASPVINIVPDSKDIITKIESLLDSRNNLIEHGWQSRRFVEMHHNHVKVANQYLKVWLN